MALVVVKDLVEELTEENKRLFNELIKAKECLNTYNEFKTFIDLISHKFKYDLDINEMQKYFELNASVETSVEQLSDVKCEITSGLQKNGVQINVEDNEVSSGRNEEAIGLSEDFGWNRTIDLSGEGFADSIPVVEGNGTQLWSGLELTSTSKTIVTKYLSQNSLLSKKSHNSEKFKCFARKCQKYFPTIASLRQHIRSCHSEKRFVCHHPGCTYKTSRNCNLKKHLTVHTTEKPESVQYKSSYLPVSHKNEVKNEIQTIDQNIEDLNHNNEESIGLNDDFSSNRIDGLSAELFADNIPVVDADATQFWSGLGLTSTSNLNKSVANPLLEKLLSINKKKVVPKKKNNNSGTVLVCHQCPKAFSTRKKLSKHVNSCHSEKRFVCQFPGCQYRTSVKYNLNKHFAYHSSERNYRCHLFGCEKSFKLKEDLNKHLIKVHKTDPKNNIETIIM